VVQKDSKEKHLEIYDATCPLVSKVHAEVIKYSKLGYECILIGHQNHPEVEGTMGQFDDSFGGSIHLVESVEDVSELKIDNSMNLAYVTQTTLSIDDTQAIMDSLKTRFPKIRGPKTNDICYATQNRQDSVKQLSLECDLVLVIGSVNSSNSNRLREIAERSGVDSYLIDSLKDLDHKWLAGRSVIGITSGASAPEHLVKELVALLQDKYNCSIYGEEEREDEGISFRLPKGLRGR
jgi:4-hydroxy-3-methylbut-2-enyl diphosphate reductase